MRRALRGPRRRNTGTYFIRQTGDFHDGLRPCIPGRAAGICDVIEAGRRGNRLYGGENMRVEMADKIVDQGWAGDFAVIHFKGLFARRLVEDEIDEARLCLGGRAGESI